MINKYIKLILSSFALGFSIHQFIEGLIGNGIMYLLISLTILFLYFKNEFLLLAFFQLRKQNLDGADKWLNKIKNPSSALVKKQQGYYNYLKGMIVSQTNINEAEKYFKSAISFGLNMDHDLAMAKLQLAGILFTKRRKHEAQKLIQEAQRLDKNGMLTDQIRIIKNQMKRSHIPNQHFGGNRMRRR